jgi:hypothetical protein
MNGSIPAERMERYVYGISDRVSVIGVEYCTVCIVNIVDIYIIYNSIKKCSAMAIHVRLGIYAVFLR